MPSIAETIAQLSKQRAALAAGNGPQASRVQALDNDRPNPGALRGLVHVPADLPAGSPLVVVLHGCTQTAAGYDIGAGWSQLADRYGFAVLFPEQQRQNNPNLCFNWFSPEDSRRDHGEAMSIRQMIAGMIGHHAIDPARVFVTGLSAGGAMASIMLATYPEVFAGGAIIAGLPYGTANTMGQAFERMRAAGTASDADLAALVRGASDHQGPWPTISVWHGSSDATVHPANADAIIGQWRSLHGVPSAPSAVETVDGFPRRVWRDAAGREVIEEFSITGMAHGTPLASSADDGSGKAGAFMLDVGISSTEHICRFWGLDRPAKARAHTSPTAAATAPASTPTRADGQLQVKPPRRLYGQPVADAKPHAPAGGVGKVIEDALRAAGLMR